MGLVACCMDIWSATLGYQWQKLSFYQNKLTEALNDKQHALGVLFLSNFFVENTNLHFYILNRASFHIDETVN